MDFGIPGIDRTQYLSKEELVIIEWAAFSPATDVTPDVDTEIDISLATSISIQIDTTAAGNVSDDNDVNVESGLDGTNWDNVNFAERNIGDNEIKTFLVSPGPYKIRLRADNNHGSDNACITARVLVRYYNAL